MSRQPADEHLPPDFETRMPDDVEIRVCYRHPDRETLVSCSSCGRPICHECMIPAPVGFHCPECVRRQSSSAPRARVVTRGQTRARWGAGGVASRTSPGTKALVGVNVAFFLFEMVFAAGMAFGGSVSMSRLTWIGALIPARIVLDHEYWRLLTSMFLHAGILHLFFNMWALWVVGSFLERAVGTLRFVVLYFISGLAGSVLVLVAGPGNVATVGASGAIFGLFGATFLWAYLNRGRDLMAGQLARSMGIVLVLNLLITFAGSAYISWQAHLGGLIGGVAAFAALYWGDRRSFRGRIGNDALAALGGILAVLCALVVWRVQTW